MGDIVQSFNGAKVYQAIDIGRKLWSLSAGDPVFIKLEDGRNINFLVDTIAKLEDKESAMKKLQVELQELTNRLASALGLPYSRGLVVSGVSKESALAKQGVQRGDVIIQVGEIPITDFTDLVRALNRHRHERVIDVIVDRVVTVRGHIVLHRYILNIPI